MLQKTGNTYCKDFFHLNYDLTHKKLDSSIIDASGRLKKALSDPAVSHYAKKSISKLLDTSHQEIARAASSCGLIYKELRPLALISGAGIAGLSASLELSAKGYRVLIGEKRTSFTRYNIINLGVESEAFLKKFNLLEKFEKTVAAIEEHVYIIFDRMNQPKLLDISDVRDLKLKDDESVCSKNAETLFTSDGIYSASIEDIQTFLLREALERGVKIYADTEFKVLSIAQDGFVKKVQVTAIKTLRPDLFFIAEGAHPKTARELNLKEKRLITACSDERWVYGNIKYPGSRTFVISVIDTSQKALEIANVIFNAKKGVINLAVTSKKDPTDDEIKNMILQRANQVYNQSIYPLAPMDFELIATSQKPVHIVNRLTEPFSKGNVFCIGDAAGSSSPLAGLGGTLGLTLVPSTVKELLEDASNRHESFQGSTNAYTQRWIQKSSAIKTFCLETYKKEHEAGT